jgi:hypothetical protein
MSDDLERLRVIVDEMPHEQALELNALLWRVRGVVSTAPPLTGAFACLAVAEACLVNSGLEIPDAAFFDKYRLVAVGLAARLAQ